MEENYRHFISLGFFCSVASELERYGLRSASGPFDWQSCDSFKERMDLINNRFEKFWEHLTVSGLYQGGGKSPYL